MDRKLQVVTTCTARDLPILKIAAEKMDSFFVEHDLYIITPKMDFSFVRNSFNRKHFIICEDDFMPHMNIRDLRKFVVDGFPKFSKMAGWYYQQFLKLQFSFFDIENDYYLIWDADTIPLRTMRFFDSDGKILLTRSRNEFHKPYFKTYRNILSEDASSDFSFISQHCIIQKSVAREMLKCIETNVVGSGSWPWKIVGSLPKDCNSLYLFSEYETYGNYIRNHYPERIRIVDREWTRGNRWQRIPTEKKLRELSESYEFSAFEKSWSGIFGGASMTYDFFKQVANEYVSKFR